MLHPIERLNIRIAFTYTLELVRFTKFAQHAPYFPTFFQRILPLMHKSLAIHDAYKHGDLETLKTLLGDRPDFPNCRGPRGVGEIILEYAIYDSPRSFIRMLLELGADPNFGDHAGFPSLIATLSCSDRPDRYEILEQLLSFGADIQQRSHNDCTPLHFAANSEDIRAMQLLLAHDATLNARTHIDDHATPLEEMEVLGRKQSIAFLRKAADKSA